MGAPSEPSASLYDTDFVGWARQQAEALRARRVDRLDYDNLIEEVESMGKQQQAELVNRLAVLLAHLLKWRYQVAQRGMHGRSWRLTVKEQRRQVARLIAKNPSLRPFVPEAMSQAYGDAVLIAARESNIAEDQLPADCPWSFEEAAEGDSMPD